MPEPDEGGDEADEHVARQQRDDRIELLVADARGDHPDCQRHVGMVAKMAASVRERSRKTATSRMMPINHNRQDLLKIHGVIAPTGATAASRNGSKARRSKSGNSC